MLGKPMFLVIMLSSFNSQFEFIVRDTVAQYYKNEFLTFVVSVESLFIKMY